MRSVVFLAFAPVPVSTVITLAPPVPNAASLSATALVSSVWPWASCCTSIVYLPGLAEAALSFADRALPLALASMSSLPPVRPAATERKPSSASAILPMDDRRASSRLTWASMIFSPGFWASSDCVRLVRMSPYWLAAGWDASPVVEVVSMAR